MRHAARKLRPARLLVLAALALIAGSCGRNKDGPVRAAFIGEPGSQFERGARLSPPAQHLRAATVAGLVALDQHGEVVPALAERWIVTDDGLSYIFRLRTSGWADGKPADGRAVQRALQSAINGLGGTSLALDLGAIRDIRAMTGRVVEIRLHAPMPGFLQLLAQPELAVPIDGRVVGAMRAERKGNAALLSLVPPDLGSEELEAEWRARIRPVELRVMPAKGAVAAFRDNSVDAVFGGRLADLALADTGPLSRGTIRLDPAQGLFGLRVLRKQGVLAEASRREALAMAIDRDTLLEPFNIGGWQPQTQIVPVGLGRDAGARTGGEAVAPGRWSGSTIEARRAEAARRLRGVAGSTGAVLTINLPAGPGMDTLLARLNENLVPVGVTLRRARTGEAADLALVDTLARHAGPSWYLNQFACVLRRGPCSPEADALVRAALGPAAEGNRATLLREAEVRLTSEEIYIPLGPPIRWSLVRGDLTGFAENGWGIHPLPPLAERPI